MLDPHLLNPYLRVADALAAKYELVKGPLGLPGHLLEILRPRSVDALISEAEFNQDGRLPYWADVWPSALGLAARILEEQGCGRTLLELGCAVGYVACLAAQRGFVVTATDYYADAGIFTQLNAALNGLPIPRQRMVDWRNYPADLTDFDVVIASDVLYEQPYCDLVASCFARSLARDGLGLLTDPQRHLAAGFTDAARRQGLVVTARREIPVEKDGRRQVIDLYELRRAVDV
ncbi:MAG: methyltransferase domain-containing protein [Pirellulales bacterium]|nr:methyltransferase domain-containing protein [Pirellulales bacterium]